MHSLLSLLFGFSLAGLIYGLSLLPSASLGQMEETEELAIRIDQETGTGERGSTLVATTRGEAAIVLSDSDARRSPERDRQSAEIGIGNQPDLTA